jgi:hypothetical protein
MEEEKVLEDWRGKWRRSIEIEGG